MKVLIFLWWMVSTFTFGFLRYIVWPIFLFAIFGPFFPIIWLFIH